MKTKKIWVSRDKYDVGCCEIHSGEPEKLDRYSYDEKKYVRCMVNEDVKTIFGALPRKCQCKCFEIKEVGE